MLPPLLQVLAQSALAAGADFARNHLSIGAVLLLLGALVGARLINLWLLQRSSRSDLRRRKPGEAGNSWFWREARFSLCVQLGALSLALALLPLTLLVGFAFAVRWVVRKAGAAWKKLRAAKAGQASAQGDSGEERASEPEKPGVLVASVAPSLLDGAMVSWVLWLLSLGADVLLAAKHDLGSGAGGLSYALLGTHSWLAWLWPLERDPATHLLVSGLVWTTAWWWSARILRLMRQGELNVNLYDGPSPNENQDRWARWYAARRRFEPFASFRKWSLLLLVATLPLLGLAALSLEPTPYAVSPAPFVLAAVTWLSLGLWLVLKGLFLPVEATAQVVAVAEVGHGWADVRADLEARLRVTFPPAEARRPGPVAARLRLEPPHPWLDSWLSAELLSRLVQSP
ncbi:MAG: hypothetical protein FJ399_20010, partial [Verrucomicrobia bacterium]|nr:hypothetical protein [Verrucomicrobiota bacterium]